MNLELLKFRLSMYLTLLIIIGVTALIVSFVLALVGVFNVYLIAGIVAVINVVEWLYGPKLIDYIYRVREARPGELDDVRAMISRISKRAGIKEPKLMVAEIDIPNAFAYGSPLTGNRVAVTRGLLRILSPDEIEAVLGHELGHIRHRDVQVMLFVSMLPAILYYIAYTFMISSFFEERNNAAGLLALIGFVSFIGYIVLNLLVLAFSRSRETFADIHATQVVDDGARKLSSALAKLYIYSYIISHRKPKEARAASTTRALFIIDPASLNVDDLRSLSGEEALEYVANRKMTFTDRIMELLSTHPNIIRRIKLLRRLEGSA
ncbi:MAG: zinc metalloprotease HtpX [Nitrososphaeria archaeon]